MAISCFACGAQMPDDSAFCPGCGLGVGASPALGTTGSISDNIAGALAYAVIPAIVFLLVEPFKKNRFIRFHCFQCLFLLLAASLLGLALRLVFAVLLFVPVLGQLMVFLICMVIFIGCLIFWMVLIVKALQGERFKVPLIGDLAEKQANA